MRQILQSLKTGAVEVVKAPAPAVRPRHILVETRRSVISPGTERMLLDFGRANLLDKARQQPDKVRQTLDKVRTDGLSATVDAVRAKLDQPIPLGYCSAGIVSAIGEGVSRFKPGDRVVSNAPHAELVVVGHNLAAKIPDDVTDDEAAFTPLAAIALQGCRLAIPQLGETFCVMGLGVIGLLTVQLLRAQGCRVIGVDLSKDRLALAASWGAETIDLSTGADPVAAAMALTEGVGVDGVLIAAATKSNDVVSHAAQMSRKRGRIVLVGVVGLSLSRADFYEKELTFQVSCSYGPGRYDSAFEVDGQDYPIGFVRWTEQRNFAAVLQQMSVGGLEVKPLISKTIPIEDATAAYARLTEESSADLGLILAYPDSATEKYTRTVTISPSNPHKEGARVALVGAGGHAARHLIPALKASGATLSTIVSRGGVSGVVEGRKSGFENATTDLDETLRDPQIDTVVVATRHDSHAAIAIKAIKAGKNVFVEKPLGLTLTEIDEVAAALKRASDGGSAPRLLVGFNRRFSPFSVQMRSALKTVPDPKTFIITVNAGSLPTEHWVHDPVQGGGRIIGEACHFVDLLQYLTDAEIVDVAAMQIGRVPRDGQVSDKATLVFSFADGSVGTIHYFANGPKQVSKERIEVFAGGKYLKIDNFTRLEGAGWPSKIAERGKQNKGNAEIIRTFVTSIRSGLPCPVPVADILNVSRWTIKASQRAAGK